MSRHIKKVSWMLPSLLLATASPHVLGQVYSGPVGIVSISALAGSDTRFSAPLHRPSEGQGSVSSITGNTILVSGAPGWLASQWVYASGSQPKTYFVEFKTGARTGHYYTITASTVDSLQVDLSGDVLEGNVVAGDEFEIAAYWSLGSLFPNQQGITTTGSITGTGAVTKILFFDPNVAGINLAASATYYYYHGAASGGPGWRRVGGGIANIKNDDVIYPDYHLLVRQDGGAPTTTISIAGTVPLRARKNVIGTLQANTAQDNMVAVDVPVPLTLAQSNLVESGAFVSSTTVTGSNGDKLLVFDDTIAGTNKAASATYYHYNGTSSGGPGWRKVGGGITNIKNDDVIFNPGSGYVIRKAATVVASNAVWTIPLPY